MPICPNGQYLRMNVPATATWAGDATPAIVDLSYPDTDSSVNSTPNGSPQPQVASVLMRPERLPLGLTSCTLGLSTISEESGGQDATPSPPARSDRRTTIN